MPGTNPQARLNEIAKEQVKGIVKKFGAPPNNIGILTVPAPGGGVSFMCHEERILVRDDYRSRVGDILVPLGIRIAEVTPVIADVVRLDLGLPPHETAEDMAKFDNEAPLIFALNQIDAELGEGVATPDHVVTVSDGIVSPCPATEPRTVDFDIEPHPGIRTDNSGDGVLIYIADTGLLKGADTAHSWLQGVLPAQDDGWDPNPPDPKTGIIPPYGGHGTFVAGVVRCMAPQADVIVSNVCKVAGSSLESDFVIDLKQALGLGVDIFHLSVCAPTRKGIPLLAFERWLALVRQYKGTVCVAPAGNSGVRWPTWPSVFPQTVSVGALTADGRDRADFSNYGGWVDVYAPGRDIINAYASGEYVYQNDPYKGDPPAKFYGMARWSGTSFSAPIVTGLIAARMSRTGENGLEAAASLLREARSNAIPGVGAVLLPTYGDDGNQ
jgi:subtilisin family serine protease